MKIILLLKVITFSSIIFSQSIDNNPSKMNVTDTGESIYGFNYKANEKPVVTASALSDGKVVMEKWTNISGTAVSAVDWNTPPNTTSEITQLEIPTDVDNYYGIRIRGYIIPSVSGSFFFYIASDDNSELWLSSDSQPENISKIAWVPSWTNSRVWTQFTEQKSAAINLTADQRYYFVVYMKEHLGGDNLAVGWETPLSGGISVIGSANISSSSDPLPVELTSFTANILENKVKLNWNTATEVNNYGFEILRSAQNNSHSESALADEESWEIVGFAAGHGNSNSPKEYSFIDDKTSEVFKNLGGLNAVLKYHLKQIDFDGKFEYSEIITVEMLRATSLPTEFRLQQNYPNPFNPTTTIKYSIPDAGTHRGVSVQLKVYDVLGNEVSELVNEQKAPGSYKVDFDANNLSAGMYLYSLSLGGFTQTKKMLLIK